MSISETGVGRGARAAEGEAHLSHGAYLARRHFSNLDGLRFICITMVIWHHSPLAKAFADQTVLSMRGFLGVDFFFVLSGFLITTLLLRERARTGRISLRGFYRRRILRIVPVYFFVVSAVAAYYILAKGQWEKLELLPYYYLFLSNFMTEHITTLSITWSLSVEEQYYLIWPLLLVLLPWRLVPWALGLLIALNLAVPLGTFAFTGIEPVRSGVLVIGLSKAVYAAILMGSLLAVALHTERGWRLISPVLAPRWAAPALFAALAGLLAAYPSYLGIWPTFSIHLLMTLCLAALVVNERTWMAGFLQTGPVARVGQISYGIYLYHLIALHIANVGLGKLGLANGWVVLVTYYAITIVIAEVSFRTLERFFLRLR